MRIGIDIDNVISNFNEELLNEAIVYDNIYKQANRKHCALLPYLGIKKALEQIKK